MDVQPTSEQETTDDAVVTTATIVDGDQTGSANLTKNVSAWFRIAGYLLLVVGAITIIFPLVAAMALEAAVGIGFLMAGLTYAFKARKNLQTNERVFGYLVAAIYILGGILLFAAPMSGIRALALAMGAVLLIESISKIILSKKLSADHPNIWIIDGIIGVVIAALILIFWPEDSIWVVGLLVGTRIALTGALLIAVSKKVLNVSIDKLVPETPLVDAGNPPQQ